MKQQGGFSALGKQESHSQGEVEQVTMAETIT